jgi:polysaccharide export outer membrane protein
MPIKNFLQLALKQFFASAQSKHTVLLVFLLMVLGFAGTATAELVIGADDALQIKVYGYDDLATETRVSSDGRISFPLIGEVSVGGQSTFEAESKIAKLLTDGGFIQSPHVTVTVLEFKSQQVSVLGFVNKPGLYPLESRSSLVDMLAMAGGISQLGDHRAIVTRHINGKTIKQEIDLRVALEHPEDSNQFAAVKGDVIYIPKAPVFYIQGEVMRPGAFPLEPKMTVSQALSLGGGLTPKGTLRGIVIERHDANGKSEEIAVKMTDAVLKDDVLIFQERLF